MTSDIQLKLDEVEATFARWNARFDESGRLVPELATV